MELPVESGDGSCCLLGINTPRTSGARLHVVGTTVRVNTPGWQHPPGAGGYRSNHMVTLNEATLAEELELTAGEEAILTKLDELNEKLDELNEKLANLSLVYNEGFSIGSID